MVACSLDNCHTFPLFYAVDLQRRLLVFRLAFLIAIYGYFIFALGLLGILSKNVIVEISILFLGGLGFFLIRGLRRERWLKRERSKLFLVVLFFIACQVLVNLIGVFGPELSFDALWYHLTLPKIYLQEHKVFFIPGGLLYYSASPQLAEMLYLPGLKLVGYTGSKLTHFLFGIGSLVAIYKLSRKFLTGEHSLIVCLLFYSQLAVGWLSTVAYTDLVLVFYQILGLLMFVDWWQNRGNRGNQGNILLIESALLFGLSACVKLIGIYSLIGIIFVLLINKISFKKVTIFLAGFFLPLLPWFSFAYLNTGNPFYPYLTNWFFKSQSGGITLLEWLLTRHPVNFLKAVWQMVFTKGEILTPIILITLPILLGGLKRVKKVKKGILGFLIPYMLIYFLLWFLTPLNYNRFLLPLVPIYLLTVFIILNKFKGNRAVWGIFLAAIFLTSVFNLFSRIVTNKKYLPLFLGHQNEKEFMRQHLNFKAGNFYDLDGFFRNYLKKDKKVLVVGIHNLFYLDFPFKEISFAKSGDEFDYLLAGRDINQERFKNYPLLYQNELSGVSLYKVKISF